MLYISAGTGGLYICVSSFDVHGGEKAPVALGLSLSHLRQNELNRHQKDKLDSQDNSFFYLMPKNSLCYICYSLF